MDNEWISEVYQHNQPRPPHISLGTVGTSTLLTLALCMWVWAARWVCYPWSCWIPFRGYQTSYYRSPRSWVVCCRVSAPLVAPVVVLWLCVSCFLEPRALVSVKCGMYIKLQYIAHVHFYRIITSYTMGFYEIPVDIRAIFLVFLLNT